MNSEGSTRISTSADTSVINPADQLPSKVAAIVDPLSALYDTVDVPDNGKIPRTSILARFKDKWKLYAKPKPRARGWTAVVGPEGPDSPCQQMYTINSFEFDALEEYNEIMRLNRQYRLSRELQLCTKGLVKIYELKIKSIKSGTKFVTETLEEDTGYPCCPMSELGNGLLDSGGAAKLTSELLCTLSHLHSLGYSQVDTHTENIVFDKEIRRPAIVDIGSTSSECIAVDGNKICENYNSASLSKNTTSNEFGHNKDEPAPMGVFYLVMLFVRLLHIENCKPFVSIEATPGATKDQLVGILSEIRSSLRVLDGESWMPFLEYCFLDGKDYMELQRLFLGSIKSSQLREELQGKFAAADTTATLWRDMIYSGDAHFNLGEYSAALWNYRESLKRMASLTIKVDDERVHVLENSGYAYMHVGMLTDAETCLKEALELYKTTHPEETKSVVLRSIYVNLYELYVLLNNKEKLCEHRDNILKIVKESGALESPDAALAEVMNSLAIGSYGQRQYKDSLTYTSEAGRILGVVYGENVASPAFVTVYSNKCSILQCLARHKEAVEAGTKALELAIRVYGEQSGELVPLIKKLGELQQTLGEYTIAARHYQRAIDIAKKCGPTVASSAQMANLCSSAAAALQSAGDYTAAKTFYNQAETHLSALHRAPQEGRENLATPRRA